MVDALVGDITTETDDEELTQSFRKLLEPGEALYAVFFASVGNKPGGVGVTDFRVIILADSIVSRHRAYASVYYSQITSVGVGDVGGKAVIAIPNVWVTAPGLVYDMQFRHDNTSRRVYQLINWNLMRVERYRLGMTKK